METDIITAWEGSNNALRDSMPDGDEIIFNVVHIERVRVLNYVSRFFSPKY